MTSIVPWALLMKKHKHTHIYSTQNEDNFINTPPFILHFMLACDYQWAVFCGNLHNREIERDQGDRYPARGDGIDPALCSTGFRVNNRNKSRDITRWIPGNFIAFHLFFKVFFFLS